MWHQHRTAWRLTLAAIWLAAVGLVAADAAWWVSARGQHGLNPGDAAVALMLVFLAIALVRPLRLRVLYKIELANKLTLTPATTDGTTSTTPATATPTATGDLDVAYNRGRVLRVLAQLFATACLCQALAWLLDGSAFVRAFFIFLSVSMFALVIMFAVRVLAWGSPGRPVLRLDDEGLHLPRFGYTLPWTELTEIRLIPLRAARRRRGQTTAIVAFIPADPQAALRELQSKGAGRRMEKSYRLHGTPLTFADQLMNQTADHIATTATAFTAAPIRRY